jgi:hypothetical protein
MIWLLAQPPPPSPVSKLDRQHTGRLRKREEGRPWARSKKAWSSINHLMLSAPPFVKTLPALQREEKLREGGLGGSHFGCDCKVFFIFLWKYLFSHIFLGNFKIERGASHI